MRTLLILLLLTTPAFAQKVTVDLSEGKASKVDSKTFEVVKTYTRSIDAVKNECNTAAAFLAEAQTQVNRYQAQYNQCNQDLASLQTIGVEEAVEEVVEEVVEETP